MTSYKIDLLPVAAQNFSVPLGANNLRMKIQWQERFGYFRIDISDQQGNILTAGRVMNVGSELLEWMYPASPSVNYGSLKVTGSDPTPDNFGIDNSLVWNNG